MPHVCVSVNAIVFSMYPLACGRNIRSFRGEIFTITSSSLLKWYCLLTPIVPEREEDGERREAKNINTATKANCLGGGVLHKEERAARSNPLTVTDPQLLSK